MNNRIKTSAVLALVISLVCSVPSHAKVGEMGTFGGISEGTRLPKTTEQLLAANSTKKAAKQTLQYKEIIMFSGKPIEFEGILTIDVGGVVDPKKEVGTYTEKHTVAPLANAPAGSPIIRRSITYTVNYRNVAGTKQVIKDYTATKWTETITIDGITYTIDTQKSISDRSLIEDKTPGVTYTKGNVSQKAVYTNAEATITQEISGTIYGYESPWSAAETQRLDIELYREGGGTWQMQYQVRPSIFVNKALQYSKNEPTAISFDGNYYEVLNSQCGLAYDIFVLPRQFEGTVNKTGSTSIEKTSAFEQLSIPVGLSFLAGHWAEEDIKQLYSMQILTGEPSQFKPSQAMTRAQFISALTRAIKLPIEQPSKRSSSSKKAAIEKLTLDVTSERADYYYLKAAFTYGLATGDNGRYRPDEPITRQEAIVVCMRAMGLENIVGNANLTRFVDDSTIAGWAKPGIYAAARIGLISGNPDGKIMPNSPMSKAEGSGLLNHLIAYIRDTMKYDYVDYIVNYAN